MPSRQEQACNCGLHLILLFIGKNHIKLQIFIKVRLDRSKLPRIRQLGCFYQNIFFELYQIRHLLFLAP